MASPLPLKGYFEEQCDAKGAGVKHKPEALGIILGTDIPWRLCILRTRGSRVTVSPGTRYAIVRSHRGQWEVSPDHVRPDPVRPR